MKKSLFLRKGGIVPLIVLLLFTAIMNAATITSNAVTGPWNFTTSWVGGVAPVAGDDVVIAAGATISLTANATCKSLTLSSTTTTGTLNLAGFTLDVTNAITVARPAAAAINIINVDAGTLNAASVSFLNAGGGTGTQNINITTGTLTVSGNVTGGAGSGVSVFNLTSTGSLKLGGSIFTALNGSIAAGTTSTVEYNGAAAQNVIEATYANLTLSGAGVKTVSNLNTLALTSGVLSIATGTQVNVSNAGVGVSKIKLGGLGKMAGTYGTTSSGAAIANDTFFTVGTGTLVVSAENRIATTVVTNVATSYTYSGLSQGHGVAVVTPTIVTTPAAPAATFSYSGTAADASVYAASATKPTKAGSYVVVATVAANENYLGSTDSDASNIAVKTLTITGLSAASKVYDSTTAATVTGTLSGVVNSEGPSIINVSFAASAFSTATVGTGKTVIANAALTGTGMANYSLTAPANLTNGVITKAVITVVNNSLTPIVVADQVYNGLLPVTGSITGGSLTGVQGADVVIVTYTGTYATKVVGNAKPITVVTTLDVTSAANYTVVTPTNVTGNVTPKTLTVTGTLTATKAYDSSVLATIAGGTITTGGGLVSGDVVTIVTGSNGTYNDNTVNTGKTIVPSFSITGADAANYALSQPASLTNGIITKKALTITASVTSKVYNGLVNDAAITGTTLTGVLPIDDVTLNVATTGTYDNKNIGTTHVVTVTGASLSGADAGNYSLPSTFTIANAIITAKALTLDNATVPTVVTKVYDGTTVASIFAPAGLVGIVGGENVVLLGTPSTGFYGTGTFSTKDVGTGKAVTSNTMLTGADAANYTLTQPIGLTGDINTADLKLNVSAQTKCFGVNYTLATTNPAGFTLHMTGLVPTAGPVNGEVVTNIVLTSVTGIAASTSAVLGVYTNEISASVLGATGTNGFLASNYTITYPVSNLASLFISAGALASVPSSNPTLCQNTVLTPITINTTNCTGIANDGVAGANNLPAGVSATWSANVITISGTPTVGSATPFNYSIALTGGCAPAVATGTITVNPTTTASVVIAATSPVCQGTSVTFTATPTNGGTTPTYQWYNGATMIPSATSSTYSYTPAVANTDVITVSMTSNATPCLAGSPATSNPVTIVVTPTTTASVVIAASPAGVVCAATLVAFTATPTNGGTTPTYQWYNGATMISGETSATYSYTPAVANTDAITVRMTSNATPCLAGSPATSNSLTTTVNAAPTAPVIAVTGGTMISSSATGNQWYTCADVIVPGATSNVFNPSVVGSYKVKVTTGSCVVSSACASVALAVNGFDSKAFSFYPNPVNNELNLSYSKEISSVKVVNVLGQVMSSKSVNATTAKVDMSGLSSGLYLVEVKSGDESKTIKVMKN